MERERGRGGGEEERNGEERREGGRAQRDSLTCTGPPYQQANYQ